MQAPERHCIACALWRQTNRFGDCEIMDNFHQFVKNIQSCLVRTLNHSLDHYMRDIPPKVDLDSFRAVRKRRQVFIKIA